MRARLHIILISPSPVNSVACASSLGPAVHSGVSVFPVTRSHFPRFLDLEFDNLAIAANIVVVVERNHTINHFREDRKPYPS